MARRKVYEENRGGRKMAGNALFKNQVKYSDIEKNKFDLSNTVKGSAKFGSLHPVYIQETVPGGVYKIGCESITRAAPMLAPLYHKVDRYVHYYFVPFRILWENWPDYITGTKDGNGRLPAFPTIPLSAVPGNYTPLDDYFGLPDPVTIPDYQAGTIISPMAHSAYQCIYNFFYRDENLIPEVNYKLVDGDNQNNTSLRTLRQRSWNYDLFTSCLPWAQKGDPVTVKLMGESAVKWLNDVPGGNEVVANSNATYGSALATISLQSQSSFDTGQLYVDLQDVEGFNVETLRYAEAMQEFLEKNARGGTRYDEFIEAHFNVNPSDARVQIPEYICGTVDNLNISEVLNTAGDTAPQGTFTGHGIAYGKDYGGTYYAEEHGYIIGIASIMPVGEYYQGIDKHWLKTTEPLDFFFPEFQHLTEVGLTVQEIYAYQNSDTANDIFGYLPIYYDYRVNQSKVVRDFRSSLDYWHLARKFAGRPQLNQTFIEVGGDLDRIFAVQDGTDYFWYMHRNDVTGILPISAYGTPSF